MYFNWFLELSEKEQKIVMYVILGIIIIGTIAYFIHKLVKKIREKRK